jgi:GGDEF domain-containing protein
MPDFSIFNEENKPAETPDVKVNESSTQVRLNLSEAYKTPPDQFAKNLKIAQESGLPGSVVENNPVEAENDLKLKKINFDEMSKRSPKTSAFLTDFNNAVIAQEDVPVLERLERVFDFRETFKGLGGSIALSFEEQAKGFLLKGADMLTSNRELLIPSNGMISEFEARQLSTEMADRMGITSDEELTRVKEGAIKQLVGEIQGIQNERSDLTPQDLNILEQGVRGGFESLANMAPAMTLMLASGGRSAPMLATIGVQTYTGSYGSSRAEGLNPEQAGWYATIDTAIEVLTEVLPTKTLETIFGGTGGTFKKEAIKFAIREMGTEQIATLGQTINAYAFDLDDQLENAESVEEMINIQLQRQAVTAISTVVAGGAQLGLAGGVNKTIDYVTRREDSVEKQSDKEQEIIDEINDVAVNSKLLERSPETFKQFVKDNDGENNTQVFIDGAKTKEYLADKDVESDPALKMLSEKVNSATDQNSDVSIPIADFATIIANTDHFAALRQHMTMSAETHTPFRKDQAKKETESYIKDLIEDAKSNVSEYVDAQNIYNEVRDQLVDTGMVTPANASAMAQIVPAWATVYARDNGLTIREAYEVSSLNIQGPHTEKNQIVDKPAIKKVEVEKRIVEKRASESKVDNRTEKNEVFEDFRKNDRRDQSRRDRISKLTPEQQYDKIYRHELTGLNNRRAFEEDVVGASVVASIDVDFLKSTNDNLSHTAGDQLLKLVANEINEVTGGKAYHISGDEFQVVGENGKQITAMLEKALKNLKAKKISSPSGELSGLQFTYGLGTNKETADAAMEQSKKDRLASGLKVKSGEVPANMRLFTEKFKQLINLPDTIEIDGVQRPTKNSEGNPIHSTEEGVRNFYKWFGDSKVVDEQGLPLVVYHGTTHDVSEFTTERSNIENDLGKGFYFTNNQEEVSDNYAGEGPDLTSRIEQLAERIEQDEEISMDEARKKAREKLSGGSPNVIPAFLSMTNPVILEKDGGTYLESDMDNDYYMDMAKDEVAESDYDDDPDGYQDALNEKAREIYYEDYNPIRVGNASELVDAFDTVSREFDIENPLNTGEIYLEEGIYANELVEKLRSMDSVISAESDDGGLAGSEFVRRVFEEAGFDGFIDKTVDVKFGSQRRVGKMMSGMDADTVHYIAFDPKKIKSAIGNRGTFSNDPNILNQQERGYYDPENSVIRLTEAANLSTFLHEFAHFMYEMELKTNNNKLDPVKDWFKKNNESLIEEANSHVTQNTEIDFTKPATVVDGNDLTAFIDGGTTGDSVKDNALRHATHEQFARAFESYLMEGKAPSVELRNVFRQFARWLTEIYKRIKNGLNVNLDDNMKKFFDRMLATEEQLQSAEGRSQYKPMFTDAVMAGMTEQEFAEYKERQLKVKDKQTETLRDKLIKELRREAQQWWIDERNDIVDEETDKLKNEPVYRAMSSLLGDGMKLDLAAVKEMIGETTVDKRGIWSHRAPPQLNNMTITGARGLHPDEAAAAFDFSSGSEMLDAIVKAPKLKTAAENNAQAIMLERHGDIMSDGSIEQKADEALQNEERADLLLAELKALNKNKRIPLLDKQAVKQLAEENIGKLSYVEIHPAKYRRAEIRNAQESAAALAAGDTETAARSKRKQILNYYLGVAATNAKNETLKIVDRMGRYRKKKVQTEIQKAENGYWDQIVKILNRFEFRKASTLKSVNKVNKNVTTWMEDLNNNQGDSLILSDAVLDELYTFHWKNVPHSELRGVNDSVKNIEHVARYSNKMALQGEEIEFKSLVTRWVDSITSFPAKFKPQRTDIITGQNYGRWAMAQMSKVPWLTSWLDGGDRVGISNQIIMQPMNEALAEKQKLWEQVGEPVMNAIKKRTKDDIKRHNSKIFIPEIKTQNEDGNLFGHQILSVALNTGNKGNLRKMLLGEGWASVDNDASISFDNPKLQAVLKYMTKEDWQLVQMIWDQMEVLYPKLAEVHRKTTGLVPPKVASTPVETPHGTFNGGYYPVKYDPNRSRRAKLNQEQADAEVDSMFGGIGSIQASVNASATNERKGSYAPIRMSLDVVPSHFQEVIHYITHHDAVRRVNKLLRNKEVEDAISSRVGPEEFDRLKPWLNDIAKDGKEQSNKTFIETIIGRLRMGTTLTIMGFKASTGIMQTLGLSNTIAEVGLSPMLQSIRMILGSPTKINESWEFAVQNSKVLKHRASNMDREIKNVMTRLGKELGVKSGRPVQDAISAFDNNKFLKKAQETSMKHIALIQVFMVDLPSWYAAYIKSIKEFGDEKKAFQYADWVIENIQGSGSTKDMSELMRNKNESIKMITMFMTFFSALWNSQRDLVKGAKAGQYSTTTVAAKLLFLFAVPVYAEMLLRGEFGGEDDDESDMQKYLLKLALYPTQSIPFVRDAANSISGEFGYNISPVASLIEQGMNATPGLVERLFTDDEVTLGQAKGTSKLLAAGAGIPGVNQAWATGEHLFDVIENGEDLTFRELAFGPDRD